MLQNSIKIQNSKFGKALAVETSKQCGGYLLGFRTDPIDKLTDIQKQIISLRQLYDKNPLFGGELSNEEHELVSTLRVILKKETSEEVGRLVKPAQPTQCDQLIYRCQNAAVNNQANVLTPALSNGTEVIQSIHRLLFFKDPVENPQDETDDDIQEAPVDRGDVLSFYLAEDPKVTRDRPIYSEELGVAIEPLPEGYTLEELWTIFPEK
ncbi:hypothetical protein T265_02547 [Opisthorchis viverrini]|uniref:BBSome complex member BBS5 PH domain-containing protein n=1 Tax=Opisthorchis viverrini TaxID=6198 RepID=A0A075AI93_OPIVI|nr:hypothetical protein T265_02547 [Opisthorchis viverrini]KER31234.1 hypothetical protein T265_02547 [Opisthorchis viverrini]